jgi:phosphoglycerol transferase MdoB-like AlkP superfamily enzyme
VTLRKLTLGEIVAGLGGALLIADLFAPWFGGASAWSALRVLLALLLLSALLGIALLLSTAFQRSQAIPVAAEVFAFAFASLTAVYLLLELLLREGPDWGAWLGLVAVLAVAGGGWAAMRAAVRP